MRMERFLRRVVFMRKTKRIMSNIIIRSLINSINIIFFLIRIDPHSDEDHDNYDNDDGDDDDGDDDDCDDDDHDGHLVDDGEVIEERPVAHCQHPSPI